MKRNLETFSRGLSLAAVTVSFAGCAAFSGYPTNFQKNETVLKTDEPYLSADVRAIGNDPSDEKRNYLTQRQYRDTVVYRRIEVIDAYYYDFESHLTGTYNAIDVGADLTTLILNGLGATTGTASAKAALAAASAGVIGAKNVINTDIFYQKTLPALVAQMRAARQQALANIEAGLANPVSKYSIDQALNDVTAYYIAGSLPSAVAQITAQAGASESSARNDIRMLRNTKYQAATPTAETIIKWLYPGGDETKTPDSARLKSLTDWMGGYKADSRLSQIPYVLLLHSNDPSFEADRAQAIKDLNIK